MLKPLTLVDDMGDTGIVQDPAEYDRLYCAEHGLPKVIDIYWGVTIGCLDCEREPRTFNNALAAVTVRRGA